MGFWRRCRNKIKQAASVKFVQFMLTPLGIILTVAVLVFVTASFHQFIYDPTQALVSQDHLTKHLRAKSDYKYQAVCGKPTGHLVSCDSKILVNGGNQIVSDGTQPASYALGPTQFHTAYQLPCTPGGTVSSICSQPSSFGPTVAIVVAGNYSEYGETIEQSLANYDSYYGLPTCTAANGCLQVVNESGASTPLPSDLGWDNEIGLDVETVHMVCQTCKIVLVEASSSYDYDLADSESTAATFNPVAISNSWGGSEYDDAVNDPKFNLPGIAVIAATGDDGSDIPADWPAGLPDVIGAAGTSLTLNTDNTRASETVWYDSGGGCSTTYDSGLYGGYLAPTWQKSLPNWSTAGCGQYKAYGDVSVDADPDTGEAINVANSSGLDQWVTAGGTSLSSPLVAGMFGLVGKVPSGVTASSIPYSSNTSSNFYDITSGNDCTSYGSSECTAGTGFDEPSGLGSPNGLGGFSPPPTQPTGLSDNVISASQIDLSWTASTDNLGVSGYYILRNGVQVGTTTSTSYPDTGLLSGTSYSYSVKAYDTLGNISPASSTQTASTYTIPTAPSGLSASSVASSSLTITWTGSTDSGGPGLAGYYLYRYVTSSGSSSAIKIASLLSTATSYPDTGLSPNVSYSYYLVAYDTASPSQTSPASSTLSVSTYAVAAPTNLHNSANGVLSTSISLAWDAPTGNGSTVAGYHIYRNGYAINFTK